MPGRTCASVIVAAVRARPQTLELYSREPAELREVLRAALIRAGLEITRLVGDVIECGNGAVIIVRAIPA